MIAKQYGEKFVDTVAFYTKDNVFYLPPESRWSYIMENAKQDDIALKIDTALYTIEKSNPALKGALPDNYYSRLQLDTAKLASLLDEINRINTDDKENDIIGRIYEYFLSKFALAEGKGKGEFYTPKCIVNLIAEMLEPYDGILYDPCCGSGGMFVQSMKFVEAHHGNKKQVSIYGQEYTNTTYKLCKMNLAIRGISANLGETAANTFTNDQHKDLKADYIMANPPFNQKAWRAENELIDDPRWDGYEVPPTSNANYGWILNIVSKLSQNGVAGFLLANGALSDDGTELKIRKQLIENNLVEAIIILPRNLFYTTDISVTLWILNKNKKARVVEQNGQLTTMKQNLITDVVQGMLPYLNNAQTEKLQEVLQHTLFGYEVTKVENDTENLEQNLVELFLSAKRIEGCSEKTLKYYNATIQAMLTCVGKGVRHIVTDDVRSYLTEYQEKNQSSKVTIDNIRRILSSFFSWLEDEDYILKSPVRRIHKVKTGTNIKETYTDEALELMRDSCTELRDLAIIDMLASTGMRVGEMVLLNRADINFNERECVVFGKGDKERIVYFDARTKIHLQNYLNSRRDENPALFVSLQKPHKRLQISGIEVRLREYGKRLGLSKVHPHKFRRTLATMAIDKGMPIEQLQQLLGHRRIDTTLQYAMVKQSNVKIAHRKYIG